MKKNIIIIAAIIILCILFFLSIPDILDQKVSEAKPKCEELYGIDARASIIDGFMYCVDAENNSHRLDL